MKISYFGWSFFLGVGKNKRKKKLRIKLSGVKICKILSLFNYSAASVESAASAVSAVSDEASTSGVASS